MTDLLGLARFGPGDPEKTAVAFLCDSLADRSPTSISFQSLMPSVAVALIPSLAPETPVERFHSPDGRFNLWLYGRLYNDDFDLHDLPHELLERYRQMGQALFAQMNGNFLLLLSDAQEQRLLLVCDRTASKPLFYAPRNGYFAFSSSLKTLLKLPGSELKISPEAVASFLANGFILEGQTFLEGIRILGPGQMVSVHQGKVEVQNYWTFTYAPARDGRPQVELEQELHSLLRKAVARRTRGSDPYAVALSGGYDSRALIGCAQQLYPDRPIHAVTWGESYRDPHSDVGIARAVIHAVRGKHFFFELVAGGLPDHFQGYVCLSEGRTDAVGNYPEELRIFREAREKLGFAYLLRGDENFGGSAAVRTEAQGLHRLSIHLMSQLWNPFAYLREPQRRQLEECNREQYHRLQQACPLEDLHDRKDYFCFHHHLFGYLNPLSQLKERALEIRNPHLDNDVLDFIAGLPTRYRLGKNLFISAVRRLLPEVCRIGFSKSSNMINWDERLRTDPILQDFVRRLLLQERNGFDEIIDQAQLAKTIDTFFSNPRPTPKKAMSWLRHRWQPQRFELTPSAEVFRLMILKLWIKEYTRGEFPWTNYRAE